MATTSGDGAGRNRSSRRLVAGLALIAAGLALAAPGPAAAQDKGGRPTVTIHAPDAEAVKKLQPVIDAARKGGAEIVVRVGDGKAEPKPAGASAAAEPAGGLAGLAAAFMRGNKRALAGMATIGDLPAGFFKAWGAIGNAGTPAVALLRVLVVLGLAFAAALAARFLTLRLVGARARPAGEKFSARLKAGLLVLAAELGAVLVFWLAAGEGTSRLLPREDVAHHLAEALARGLVLVAFYRAIGVFVLAPSAPARRLLPAPNAGRIQALMLGYAALVAFTVESVALAAEVTPAAVEAAIAWAAFAGLVLTLYKIAWFWRVRADIGAAIRAGAPDPAKPTALRRAAAALWAPVFIAVAIVIWAVTRIAAGLPDGLRWIWAAGVTQNLVVILPLVAGGYGALLAERMPAGGAPSVRQRTVLIVARGLGAGLIWLVGLWILAATWEIDLFGGEGAEAAARRAVLGALAVAVVGWTLVAVLRGVFDAYAPKPVSLLPGQEDEGDGAPQSRLATVMPLLRHVVLVAVAAVAVLVFLSTLGVDIAPLLAGAGIVGLAISFGSQTLVRDIVSGIFFMADDAFRVGEYIDTGRLKGTVEKISLRSVRLRHQNGQIHTVPFGQIAAVTNFSRDWSTVKFNIALSLGTDVEAVRKLAKKVGQGMMEEADLAAKIIQPLKLQGIADVADQSLVVRFKITAKPADAVFVQRQALRRLYEAFAAKGIAFAQSTVTVQGADPATTAAAGAAGAAARAGS
jgi:moderate conductance mechanosensitive channel